MGTNHRVRTITAAIHLLMAFLLKITMVMVETENAARLQSCNGESNHQASHNCYHSQQNGESQESWAVKGPLILLQQGEIVHTGPPANIFTVNLIEALNLYSSVCNATAVVTSFFIRLGMWSSFSGHNWKDSYNWYTCSPANSGLLQFCVQYIIINIYNIRTCILYCPTFHPHPALL